MHLTPVVACRDTSSPMRVTCCVSSRLMLPSKPQRGLKRGSEAACVFSSINLRRVVRKRVRGGGGLGVGVKVGVAVAVEVEVGVAVAVKVDTECMSVCGRVSGWGWEGGGCSGDVFVSVCL